MIAKVQLSFEIKREGFPKVEGKIPISDFCYLVHFSGMAVIIKRDNYLLLKFEMTEQTHRDDCVSNERRLIRFNELIY